MICTILAVFLLGGCTKTEEFPSATPSEVPSATPVPLIFQNIEVRRVGQKGIGFIDIPADWADATKSDRTTTDVILNYLDHISGFTYVVSMYSRTVKEQKADEITDIPVSNLMSDHLAEKTEEDQEKIDDYGQWDDTVAEMSSARGRISYSDGTVYHCWIFRDSTGVLHVIEIHTKNEEATLHCDELCELVINSFDLTK